MKLAKIITALLLTVSLFAGCSSGDRSNSGDAAGQTLRVVASFAPVYAMTLALTDGTENIAVSCMAASSTGCLHDYQITAADMKSVDSADLYIIGGAGMEGSFLDKVESAYPDLNIVDSSQGVSLIAESEDEYNAHIWLSTDNAAIMSGNIAAALEEASPENAQIIEANRAAFAEQMEALRETYQPQFDALTHRKIITFHEAFEYLAEEFGLEVSAVIEVEPGTAPDPQTLNELIESVRTGGVTAIFTEPQYPGGTAQVIAAETGAAVYSLDPIVTGDMDKNSFATVLESDLQTLITALS